MIKVKVVANPEVFAVIKETKIIQKLGFGFRLQEPDVVVVFSDDYEAATKNEVQNSNGAPVVIVGDDVALAKQLGARHYVPSHPTVPSDRLRKAINEAYVEGKTKPTKLTPKEQHLVEKDKHGIGKTFDCEVGK
jgi:hypothetical protein